MSTTKITATVIGQASDKFTQEELTAAFTKVQSKRGWKFPISATIPASEKEITNAAIEHFAGGQAEFEESVVDGKLRVTAPGYYMVIGA